MKIELTKQVFTDDLKGRVVKPSMGLNDANFVYTPAIKTDLAATFQRATATLAQGGRG